jgi:hypothetical protein
MGKAERLRMSVLLREMRRVFRAHGSLPRLDSDDFALCEAWRAVEKHIEHNSRHREAGDICRRGHALTEANVLPTSSGGRSCRACSNTRARMRRAERGAA